MESFRINENLEAVCEWKKTRVAFKHEATLLRDGREVLTVKICYLNRTWERYTYESVLYKLLEKSKEFISGDEGVDFKTAILNGGEREMSALRSVGIVAALGDIFGKNQKESNDWKARMLNAGLGGLGLEMPDDWDTLSETEKTRRLDRTIEQIVGTPIERLRELRKGQSKKEKQARYIRAELK